MTESILKAILRLFAIVSLLLPDDKRQNIEKIIESYLLQLVSSDKVIQYISIYRFYYNDFKERTEYRLKDKNHFISVKSILIAEMINKTLLRNQKALFFLQLLDMLSCKDKISTSDEDYIKTLGISLNVSEELYNNCSAFILKSLIDIPRKESVLVIDNSEKWDESEQKGINHWQQKNLRGKIVFLFIEEINNIFFRHSVVDDQLLLSGRKVIPGRTYSFDKGSVLHSLLIGAIHYSDVQRFFFSHKSQQKFVLEAIDLEYKFSQSENGIFRVSVSIDSGLLVGIMGGSGVGKSTLMNLLNGNITPTHGKALINGFDVHHEKREMHGIIGYIPQEDLLIEELTVFQNLYFNAKLCFGNLTEIEIEKQVNDLLRDLDLYDIKELKVGGVLNKFISGGQRKRLNISLELIREPYLLFVDEPTSGLSSTDSEMVMDLLKHQTQMGKLVVINIHQPSSNIFKMFDKLLVLDRGGRTVFFGNPVDALVYFKSARQLINSDEGECTTCGNLNPEQILQIIEAHEINNLGKNTSNRLVTAEEWYGLYKKNIEPNFKIHRYKKSKIPRSLLNIPNKFSQFKIFSLRNLISKLSDRQYILINLLEAPLLALILGIFTRYNSGNAISDNAYVFAGNVNLPVYIFMSVIVALFLGMMVSAEEIIRDRKIIQRETFLNLSKFSYYNSKVVLLLVLSAIQALSFVLIGNCILGIKGMLLPYWLILFSASTFSNILGLNISDSLKSVVAIYILIPLLLVPQILLGGAMVKFDKLNKQITSQEYVPIIGDLMASRWAYEALAVNQFKNNRYQKYFYPIELKESQASYRLNYFIPELQSVLEECTKKSSPATEKNYLRKRLTILRNGIATLASFSKDIPVFSGARLINETDFNSDVAREIDLYLQKAKNYFLKLLDMSLQKKDKLIRDLSLQLGGKTKLIDIRKNYYNDNLAELVLNKRDNDKIILYKNHLVQKDEPIYTLPVSKFGRAHFYSPVKRIGNLTIDTFWFNTIILWFMNIVFYLFLQLGIFKGAVNLLDRSYVGKSKIKLKFWN